MLITAMLLILPRRAEQRRYVTVHAYAVCCYSMARVPLLTPHAERGYAVTPLTLLRAPPVLMPLHAAIFSRYCLRCFIIDIVDMPPLFCHALLHAMLPLATLMPLLLSSLPCCHTCITLFA